MGVKSVCRAIHKRVSSASAGSSRRAKLQSTLAASEKKSGLKLKYVIKNTFSASVVSWIPDMVRKFGINLGTIIVFGFQGASNAGVYFIGFSVFNACSR